MVFSGRTLALLGAIPESFFILACTSIRIPFATIPLTLLAAVIFNFSLLACFNFFIYANLISPLRHLPGPKAARPLYGHSMAMFETPPGRSFYRWIQSIPNNGLIRYQGLWNQDGLLVTSPAGLAEILVAKTYQFEKPENAREHLRIVLGDGLVCVEGDEHKFQRKRIMPSFGFRHIKDLYPVMWTKAETLCDRIDAEFGSDGTATVEVMEWASKATLDAIGVAALGRDFNSIYNSEDELANMYNVLTSPSPTKLAWFAASLLFGPNKVMNLPLPMNRQIKKISLQLREVCRRLVRDKREAISKHGDEHYDILSVLIKSNDFSDDELVDQMLTFLAAGSDTTSLTFTWTCYLLAKYPHVQQKLREEIFAVKKQLFSENVTDGSLATTLESLPYLNGVFHETLRLFPTVPMTQRVSNTATTVLGHPIPKGTEFTFPITSINRLPEFWGPDAAEYKPERWIDKETGKPNNHGGAPNNYCLLTFLAGPRSCIGQNFARAELRCLLATWITRFEMEDANPREPIPIGAVTMKPSDGMTLRLRRVQPKA